MKKIFLGLMLVVTMTVFVSSCFADGNFLSYVTDELCRAAFEKAVSEGEPIDYVEGWYYADSVYSYCGILNVTNEMGYIPEDSDEIAEHYTNLLRKDGYKGRVMLLPVGELDGEIIYEMVISIYDGTNINDMKGENVGNGYLKEGLFYDTLYALCYIQ